MEEVLHRWELEMDKYVRSQYTANDLFHVIPYGNYSMSQEVGIDIYIITYIRR